MNETIMKQLVIKRMSSAQLGIRLTQQEIEKIADFLKATTGVQPSVEYPLLPVPTKDPPLPEID